MADPRARTEGSRELGRIVFFPDAVFAITLLVLDIHVPELSERLVDEQLPERLLELWPKYLSYVLSFLVILMYCMAYHSTFRAIKRYDRGV